MSSPLSNNALHWQRTTNDLGAIISIARVNPIPILSWAGFAIFLQYTPTIITGILTPPLTQEQHDQHSLKVQAQARFLNSPN